MKNIYSFILLIAISASSSAIAQDYNKWSVGLNVGGRLLAKPALGLDKAAKILYYNSRYIFRARCNSSPAVKPASRKVDLVKFQSRQLKSG